MTNLPKSVSNEVKMSLAETILRMTETFFSVLICFSKYIYLKHNNLPESISAEVKNVSGRENFKDG